MSGSPALLRGGRTCLAAAFPSPSPSPLLLFFCAVALGPRINNVGWMETALYARAGEVGTVPTKPARETAPLWMRQEVSMIAGNGGSGM